MSSPTEDDNTETRARHGVGDSEQPAESTAGDGNTSRGFQQVQQHLGAAGGTATAAAPGGERYFSVRWMLERERAREASDDCSSAFAIIPVVGVCLLALYIIWLDQAAQRFVLWLARATPLERFSPFKIILSDALIDDWEEWPGPGFIGGGGGGRDGVPMMEAFA